MLNLKEHTLFQNLTEEEFAICETFLSSKSANKDEVIVKEGDKDSEIYFIAKGEVEVLKNDWVPGESYRIAVLKENDVFGEMAFMGDQIRHATIKALEPCEFVVFRFDDFVSKHAAIASKITRNVSRLLTERLSATGQAVAAGQRKELLLQKKRAVMSNLVVKVFALMTLFQITMSFTLKFIAVHYISILLAFFLIGVSLLAIKWIKETGYPPKLYGLTLRNWKRSVIESLLFSIPFLAGAVLLKQLLIKYDPIYHNAPLFQMGLPDITSSAHGKLFLFLSCLLYILFSPAQEFIFRGIIQSSLQRLLHSPKRVFYAVLVSNLIFLQAHFYFDFSIIIILPGLFWSWLYLRHRTLIGVSLSHMLIGFWAFYIVGMRF
jgi:CRP-like cAMP-binding protein/membrane protease YdiL (CAAX protease family)